MTTKEQERQALEQIRKIVADLGENSYIGTAFDGCFEIAEENIENDFACSMKQRAEIEAKRAIDNGYEIDRLRKIISTLELDARDLRISIERTKSEASTRETALKEQIKSLEAKAITEDLYKSLWLLASDTVDEATHSMAASADIVVRLADAPSDIGFKHSVNAYKVAKAKQENASEILRKLEEIAPAGL